MKATPLPQAAQAGHLTDAFRRASVLGEACISAVDVMTSLLKLRSHTLRLRLDYEGIVENVPNSLILKMGRLDSAGRPSYANRREISFYRHIAPALRVVPGCYEVVDATDNSAWHLLLEDLTDTHFIATEHPLPPSFEQCRIIVQAWARFHATWWDNPRLGVSVGKWPDVNWDQYLSSCAEQSRDFAGRFGEIIPHERQELYERLFDRGSQLVARYRARRNLTLTHGDAHWWNCYLPHDGSEDVRLLDWESWSINIGTTDLAYMMAMLWYPDLRHRIERPLLDHYHAALLAHGVSGYDRQALDDDYRLSVLLLILRPIRQAASKIPPRVWWHNLERIMLAVDELDCRDLLA